MDKQSVFKSLYFICSCVTDKPDMIRSSRLAISKPCQLGLLQVAPLVQCQRRQYLLRTPSLVKTLLRLPPDPPFVLLVVFSSDLLRYRMDFLLPTLFSSATKSPNCRWLQLHWLQTYTILFKLCQTWIMSGSGRVECTLLLAPRPCPISHILKISRLRSFPMERSRSQYHRLLPRSARGVTSILLPQLTATSGALLMTKDHSFSQWVLQHHRCLFHGNPLTSS